MTMADLLDPQRNCWRIERAERLGFIVDAGPYFETVADAIERAERSVFIVGWDIHSRVLLRRGETRQPSELRDVIDRAVHTHPDLHVHLLIWDFAVIFALERELLSSARFKSHPRVHFHFAADHPRGGSHHQKIVVVDDAVAFAGGIDLTIARWDRPEHAPGDALRVLPNGEPYGPFHDVQVGVSGAAARALGALARQRWFEATKERLPESPPLGADAATRWPARLPVHLEGVDVAIARTAPAFDGRPAIQEVEQLHLDAIAAADETLYIENQYLTSEVIRDALAARLGEEDGPEIVIITPRGQSGRLEEVTMGEMRRAWVARLRHVDEHGRLRVLYPVVAGDEDAFVNVHAKVLVVDDRLLVIGSANLSDRSMRLDTECSIAISAADATTRDAIRQFRDGLVAEHSGASLESVAREIERTSLVAAIDDLASEGHRRLAPVQAAPVERDREVPLRPLADPTRPVDEALADLAVPEHGLRSLAKRRLPRAVALIAALLGLAAAWAWTPLATWLEPDHLATVAAPLSHGWLGAIAAVVCIALTTLAMVPITALIVVATLLFGPWKGAAIGLCGSIVGAWIGYALGRAALGDAVADMLGERFDRVQRGLRDRGLLAVVAVRIVPVAPFTVVNIVAGSSGVGLRDFLIGTALGMLPGAIGLALAADRVAAAVQSPDLPTVVIAAAAVLVVVGALHHLRAWLARITSDAH